MRASIGRGRISRRAFVFLPLVVLLGLSAATLGVVYGLKAPPKQTSSTSYNKGNKWGPTFGLPIVALFFVWQAGRWAEQRGTGSANAVFGGILALMNLAVGINAYRVTLGKGNGATATQVARGSPPAPVSAAPVRPAPPAWTPPPALPPAAESGEPAVAPGASPSPVTPPTPDGAPARRGPSPFEIERAAAEAKAAPIVEAFQVKLAEEASAWPRRRRGLRRTWPRRRRMTSGC